MSGASRPLEPLVGTPAASSAQPHADAGEAAAPLFYVYCIVEAGTDAHAMLDARRVLGLDPGQPLFPVTAGGLVAAVSYVPSDVFSEDPLNRLLADLPALAPYALRHEEAIRALLPRAPSLLPLAFGAVYWSRQGVHELLATEAVSLQRRLDWLRGRQEWELKVFCRPDALTATVEATDEGIRALDAEARTAGPGRAYLLERRRQLQLRAAAQQTLHQALLSARDRLATVAAVARLDMARSDAPEISELVCRMAALVSKGMVDAFCAEAAALSRDDAALGLTFELSGPWAAYSFVKDAPGTDRDAGAPIESAPQEGNADG